MAKEKILVVEDDEDILKLVQYNLDKEGYRVEAAMSGEKALDAVAVAPPNLIILDLMLPGVDGLEVCQRLRRNPTTESIPIVMLTAKGEESDIVTGLELGANDYVTKPFSPKVLVARIRALIRTASNKEPSDTAVLKTEHLMIHPGRHEVFVEGSPVELTYGEFRLLHLLVRRQRWVFTRGQIADAVRGPLNVSTERAVDVQVVGLRKKLGSVGSCIRTVRGVGYKYQE